jgi:hypothetical protein
VHLALGIAEDDRRVRVLVLEDEGEIGLLVGLRADVIEVLDLVDGEPIGRKRDELRFPEESARR